MSDVFERLLQERCDLEIKVHRLSKFIEDCSDVCDRAFKGVSDQQYVLLQEQEQCMRAYLGVLEKRIKLWKSEY